MYLKIQIRLDIYYIVTILSRYNYNSNIKYIVAIKRVLRYLKEILNYKIIYEIVNNLKKLYRRELSVRLEDSLISKNIYLSSLRRCY